MDTIQALLTRRSIRKYTAQSISNNTMQELIQAAMCAPSAGNQQPWHFVIIDDKSILQQITAFHPNASMLSEANKAILICGDEQLEKHKGYWMLDCSAATENCLLAAHAYGLGACWLGMYPKQDRILKMRQLLHLPDHVIPCSLIALGYPAEQKEPCKRFKKERIHNNSW